MENDINTLKLIEMASAHLKVQGIQSGIVPMPGTDKSIIIGSPAEVVELMPELRGAIPAAWHNFARAIADLPHGAEANIAGMQSKAAQLLAAEDARAKVLPKDEGAVPDTFAVNFIEQRAAQYLQDHADTEPGTGAVAFEFGETGREYHSTLVELADDIRSALKQSDDAQPDACDVPPTGWSCTRVAGHAGPCAAQPVAASAGIEGLDKWNASRKHLGAMQMCDGGNYLKRVDVERLLATQSAQGAQPDLHNAIMNLRCDVQNCILGGAQAEMAYKMGHRDARHGAAELVGAHEAGEAAPAAPLQTMDDTTRDEALEEAALAAEDEDIPTMTECGYTSDDGSRLRSNSAAAIRALVGQQVAQGEKGGDDA